MKILFLISTLANGGAERAMSNITTHLPEGVEADILLNSISDNDYPTNARKIDLGMKPGRKKNLIYQLEALYKRVRIISKLKKENKYDACVSFMESANICNIITGKKYCKTIISVRVSVEQDKSLTYRYIVSPLIRIFYKKADKIAAVSEGVRKGLIEYYNLDKDKIITVTNGYDVERIHEQMKEYNKIFSKNNENDFVFATVGRFQFQKAHWHLIRAFSKTVKACPNAKLLIIGQGEEREYLSQLINEYNLKDCIYLLPFQKNPFSVLSKCDAYVMPSMFEGYCNALCEALVCGLPCIATDFQSSAREILAPDTPITKKNTDKIEYAKYGILVPVCSGKKYSVSDELEKEEILLAEAMIEMYQNKELYNKYKTDSQIRAKELGINQKVSEWVQLVKN